MNITEYDKYHEAKIHADSLFPYITYICTIPLNFTEVPIHWHNDMEIIYIKKGSGFVSLNFNNYPVSAGCIVIVLPGQLHGITGPEDASSMEYENIIFSTDMLISSHSDELEKEFFTPLLSGKIFFNQIITPDSESYKAYSSCIDRADDICKTFPDGYKLVIKSCLFDLMYEICRNSKKQSDVIPDKNITRIKAILQYIEDNYQEEITIAQIACVCNFSESHFMRFFKNSLGMSFIDYLNDYRLSMAARMLTSSEERIIDIAINCSYNNLSYFNRIFKKKYGLTPSEYRHK